MGTHNVDLSLDLQNLKIVQLCLFICYVFVYFLLLPVIGLPRLLVCPCITWIKFWGLQYVIQMFYWCVGKEKIISPGWFMNWTALWFNLSSLSLIKIPLETKLDNNESTNRLRWVCEPLAQLSEWRHVRNMTVIVLGEEITVILGKFSHFLLHFTLQLQGL